jgi:hypothetical protein
MEFLNQDQVSAKVREALALGKTHIVCHVNFPLSSVFSNEDWHLISYGPNGQVLVICDSNMNKEHKTRLVNEWVMAGYPCCLKCDEIAKLIWKNRYC